MAKTPTKARQRKPGKKSGKAATKKQQKVRKKHQKRKARAESKVDALADRLAGIATTEAARGGTVEADDEMETKKPPVSRQELKKKLKAKIAGHALDRTQGLEKGVQDSNGLKKQKRPPGNRRKMDVT